MTSPVAAPEWLQRMRQEAAVVSGTQLGTQAREDWLYTAPKDLLPSTAIADPDEIRRIVATNALPDAWQVLVFVGGVFSPELSRTAPESSGIVVEPMAVALDLHPGDLFARLGRSDAEDGIFLAMDRERWTDGTFVRVGADQKTSGTVQILEVGSGTSWLRHLVLLGEGASASIVETHVSPESTTIAAHSVTEVRLAPGANLSHVRLRSHGAGGHHYGALLASLESRARLESRSFAFGGALARDDYQVSLDAPDAFALLHGLVKTRGTEKADLSVKLRHASPDCQSDQSFKMLADDRSQANFHGAVYVDRDAQRTAARQSNRNLLLSREASVNSRPQLEILADDVKCSHGSATGRLDEKALRFLRMRGLSESGARALLVRAFAGEMVLPLPEGDLRDRVDSLLGGE